MPSLERDGEILILDLGDGENRLNPDWIDDVLARLDEVEAAPAPRALVTVGSGKIWSNGLDLDWMQAHPDSADTFIARVHELLARFLSASVPTVAALQGHAFAAGAMLALAHDQRVMRADRGYFCLPEVDIGIPFTPGMSALILARLPRATAHEAMTTGRRYGGGEAAGAGIVEEAAGEGEVLARALDRARPLAGKDPGTLGAIKRGMYADTVEALRHSPGL